MVLDYTFIYKWIENAKGFIDDDKNTEDALFSMGMNIGIGFTSALYAQSIYLDVFYYR